MMKFDGNNNDFDVEYLKNGIKITIFEKTRHQIFSFGVSFLENINVENEVQTWLAADYAINLKERVNKCQN